ncbi:alpha-amylase family protein [Actinomadura rubrisoli]|uniref:Alpha-amylase n=1 Tax=Actinomadura rubrisoli TaxID=2530368 RepID=A0A4V2YT78_9ACTN|nr:alpha-amylase family protein [Actinomadura rubrisoli]TDD72787.1 trehalose synthase [Actinomadura rubrisoli]
MVMQRPPWWKNSVFYCLNVKTFSDGNGDGWGDFPGLTQRLDYLKWLGVGCIWLMPFHPSEDRDDGYDITDYYAVDERLGTLGDFVAFVHEARAHGIRVIGDLVINHTSARHPWFLRSREGRDSPYRSWYVWVDEPPPGDGEPIAVFPHDDPSPWRYDDRTDQYYLHQFYRHQPDLNLANPEVRAEIERVVGFWLQLGLSGFRVDAAPHLMLGTGRGGQTSACDVHAYIAELRSFVTSRCPDAILLGEVNRPYKEAARFLGRQSGTGDELTMCLDFEGMQQMHLALARRDPRLLTESILRRPVPPGTGRWASFVRNHDELVLDLLSEDERNAVFQAFGPDENMKYQGRGLRLRLPTMMRGDLRRIKMVYSLLFSLPATVVLLYGEEIGMGEDLEARGRLSVRCPMRWEPGSGSDAASSAPPVKPVTQERDPDGVCVQAQRDDPDSLLSWIRLLIRLSREYTAFGGDDFLPLETAAAHALAHLRQHEGQNVLCLHNFSKEPAEAAVRLELGEREGPIELTDLLHPGDSYQAEPSGDAVVRLDAYQSRWLSVAEGERHLQ